MTTCATCPQPPVVGSYSDFVKLLSDKMGVDLAQDKVTSAQEFSDMQKAANELFDDIVFSLRWSHQVMRSTWLRRLHQQYLEA